MCIDSEEKARPGGGGRRVGVDTLIGRGGVTRVEQGRTKRPLAVWHDGSHHRRMGEDDHRC